MANEMLLEMDRLRRESDGLDNENINKHIREFSDSLDSTKLKEITSPKSNNNDDDIGNDYEIINSTNSNPNPNAKGRNLASNTKQDDEFDATLIETIEVSLSKKNSKHSLGNGNDSGKLEPTISNHSEISNIESINKKTSLTLDNKELDLEQTGNIDENALDIDYTDKIAKTSNILNTNTKTNNNSNNNNNNNNGEDEVLKELNNGNFRSDTVKGRAGSVTQTFEVRSSPHTILNNSNNTNLDANELNINNNINNNSSNMDNLDGNNANRNISNNNNNINMNYNFNPFYRANGINAKDRSFSDTLHSFADANITTRATAHSYDRMFSDHTQSGMSATVSNTNNINNINNNISTNYNSYSSNNITHTNTNTNTNTNTTLTTSMAKFGVGMQSRPPKYNTGLTPMISGSFGLNNTIPSIPTLPRSNVNNIGAIGNIGVNLNGTGTSNASTQMASIGTVGSMSQHQQQAIQITNTPNSYQPPLPSGNTGRTSNSNNNDINNNVLNDMVVNDSFQSQRSDSRQSISLSHHSSVGNGMGSNRMDIADITQHNMAPYINVNNVGSGVKESLIATQRNEEAKSGIIGFINWYLEPIHTKSTFKFSNYLFLCLYL